MTPAELQELRAQTVVTVERAAELLGCRRTLAYRLVRETGRLCEGVRPIRVGRLWKVPVRQLLLVLGYSEARDTPSFDNGGL